MVARPVLAQAAGAVTGTIVASKSGRPVADAVILMQGSIVGARSGTRGEFRLATTATGTVTLNVTRIGFKPATAQATVGGPTKEANGA